MTLEISRVTSITNSLGEGPLWDADTSRLFWVDSLQGRIFCLMPSEEVLNWKVPGMIGSLAVVDDQKLLVALTKGLYFFYLETQELVLLESLESQIAETRMNDGKTDRFGNFIVGSMGMKVRDRGVGNLYRLRPNSSIEVLDQDVIVANGPCFSPDGSVFYFNDGRRRILRYDYSPSQPLRNRQAFFSGIDYGTSPDGATVDEDGNVWVALVGSGEVGCLRPDGVLIDRIKMPIDRPSSVMFGGDQLEDLFVTSISDSGNNVSLEPGAGGLYRVRGLGVRGLPESRFFRKRAHIA